MTGSLVVRALGTATPNRRPDPNVVHHSVQGAQYTALSFGKRPGGSGVLGNMPPSAARTTRRDGRKHLREPADRAPRSALVVHEGLAFRGPSTTSMCSTTASGATRPWTTFLRSRTRPEPGASQSRLPPTFYPRINRLNSERRSLEAIAPHQAMGRAGLAPEEAITNGSQDRHLPLHLVGLSRSCFRRMP